MKANLRETFKDREWFASCFFDDERAGIVLENSTIVVGLGAGMTYAEAKKIADEHNAGLGGRDES